MEFGEAQGPPGEAGGRRTLPATVWLLTLRAQGRKDMENSSRYSLRARGCQAPRRRYTWFTV